MITCSNYIWKNLEIKIRERIIKPLLLLTISDSITNKKIQLIDETIIWYNLPNALTKLGSIIKDLVFACDGTIINNPKFLWRLLDDRVEELCSYVSGLENCNTNIPNGRISIKSTDWGVLTTAEAWSSYLISSGATYAEITNFTLVNGVVSFDIYTDLVTLDLQIKNITDVYEISTSTLEIVYLGYNQIIDFNPLSPISNLVWLIDLGFNLIEEFNPTIALPESVIYLYLNGNPLLEFNPTQPIVNLEFLTLQNTSITDFNPLILLTNLIELDLRNNSITSFNPTQQLVSLQNLFLESNQLTDFNPTQQLVSLLELELGVNQLTDFNPTQQLVNLQILRLTNNQIVSFNPTITLDNLSNLILGNNLLDLAGYTITENWANSIILLNGSFESGGNVDSVVGTNLETILISKGWTVQG